MAVTPFDERVAALDADTLTELMRSRHSVRAFADRPIEKPGAEHPTKPAERLCRVNGEAPAWFSAGVEAARLAPTALNQQRFRFELLEDGRTVRARALPTVSCGKVDLGIARLHFELGANAVSRDWAFEA